MLRKTVSVAVLIAVVHLAGGRPQAHHAFAADFDGTKKVTMSGTVAEMQWINPHSWLWVNVTAANGQVERWGFEFGPPNALFRRGWTKSTVPPGLKLTIDGFLAKDGRKLAYAQSVTLPDGKKLFSGSANAGAPADAPK